MLRRAPSVWLVPLLLLAGVHAAAAAPKVVVTIKPLYALVAQVMAGVGRPQMLVKGPASPHLYALKPSDLAALNGADIVFRASAATEPFFRQADASVAAAGGAGDPARCTRRRPPRSAAWVFHFEASADRAPPRACRRQGERLRRRTSGSIPTMPRPMVDRIEQALSAKDPVNADAFKVNATALKRQLDALQAELQSALQPSPASPTSSRTTPSSTWNAAMASTSSAPSRSAPNWRRAPSAWANCVRKSCRSAPLCVCRTTSRQAPDR